jgi:hypothetical protein
MCQSACHTSELRKSNSAAYKCLADGKAMMRVSAKRQEFGMAAQATIIEMRETACLSLTLKGKCARGNRCIFSHKVTADGGYTGARYCSTCTIALRSRPEPLPFLFENFNLFC